MAVPSGGMPRVRSALRGMLLGLPTFFPSGADALSTLLTRPGEWRAGEPSVIAQFGAIAAGREARVVAETRILLQRRLHWAHRLGDGDRDMELDRVQNSIRSYEYVVAQIERESDPIIALERMPSIPPPTVLGASRIENIPSDLRDEWRQVCRHYADRVRHHYDSEARHRLLDGLELSWRAELQRVVDGLRHSPLISTTVPAIAVPAVSMVEDHEVDSEGPSPTC